MWRYEKLWLGLTQVRTEADEELDDTEMCGPLGPTYDFRVA